MKIVYIAGPYNGADYHIIDRNIARAREAAAFLAGRGIGFFCPHLNSAHFEVITPEVPEQFWKALDLRMLEACDALLLIEGWERSSGSVAEKERAEALGIPVLIYAHLFSLSGSESAFGRFLREAAVQR